MWGGVAVGVAVNCLRAEPNKRCECTREVKGKCQGLTQCGFFPDSKFHIVATGSPLYRDVVQGGPSRPQACLPSLSSSLPASRVSYSNYRSSVWKGKRRNAEVAVREERAWSP